MIITKKSDWETWTNKGIVPTNDLLLEMMQELVDAIHNIEHIYGQKASIVSRSMINDWYNLSLTAQARNLTTYPRI